MKINTIALDTNVVSELINPKGSLAVRQWVAARPMTNIFTTTITQAEILYGIALLPSPKAQKRTQPRGRIDVCRRLRRENITV